MRFTAFSLPGSSRGENQRVAGSKRRPDFVLGSRREPRAARLASVTAQQRLRGSVDRVAPRIAERRPGSHIARDVHDPLMAAHDTPRVSIRRRRAPPAHTRTLKRRRDATRPWPRARSVSDFTTSIRTAIGLRERRWWNRTNSVAPDLLANARKGLRRRKTDIGVSSSDIAGNAPARAECECEAGSRDRMSDRTKSHRMAM